ncbi:Alpha-1,3/1,6-mannosyltransferase alg-2 [Golovinomyces cichoracearum]|uniref:Alpha-1,3/1,6-mannosyltransferase ALG2 n=1 Tax=Golovinomyces cichoracearum TaxID=62708 RepID=A0A420IAC5_9PEZI|nr:Alpha-1,3/1,6-mannosyltransferase alg-2 [Golovinomyces cichoracearum]
MKLENKNIIFFHPDLGIGGAERLIIDAAVGLQNRGHKVVIYTSHCDPQHCFEEVRAGSLDVRVCGNSIVPASIFSKCSIICAILRQLHVIFLTYFTSELTNLKPDVFIIDQLSAGLPWLAYLHPDTKILFYCHFPDLLLTQNRANLWKSLYRIPFDYVEKYSMTFADSVVVNSGFTKRIVEKVFPILANDKNIEVIYPCVYNRERKPKNEEKLEINLVDRQILLSINRFEKKKNIGLAISAYAGLNSHVRQGVRLIIAGMRLRQSLGLKTQTIKKSLNSLDSLEDVDVLFLLSISDYMKDILLKSARLLIYTPTNEHFGIVPLEAMLAGVPVLAANTGGPLETVVQGQTGWLCSPDDISRWTEVIQNVFHRIPAEDLRMIGENGIKRVKQEFCQTKMIARFEETISKMSDTSRKSTRRFSFLMKSVGVIFSIIIAFLILKMRTIASNYNFYFS